MITVKQILEQYSLETDKATADEIKLAELSDAGLFESSKLPIIKRSLNKNVNEMTEAEKKTLKYLLESLMAHVLVEKNQKVDKSAYPSDKDMPTVIILKRKAIRVFPDNQKIGMYYSQALDRYISIPFGPNVKDLSPQLNESNNKRTSIADLSGQALANKWEKSSSEKRTSIAGNLSPTQRSQVSGGNRAALNYIAASNASGSVKVGAALGLGLRAFIDKARGVRAMKSQPESQPESKPKPKSQTEPVSKPNVPVAQRSGATMSRSMSNRKISESFKNNLQTIRKERLDEGDISDFGRSAANMITFGGADYAAAGGEYLRKKITGQDTSYSDELAKQKAETEKSSDSTASKVGSVAGAVLGIGGIAKGISSYGAKQIAKKGGDKLKARYERRYGKQPSSFKQGIKRIGSKLAGAASLAGALGGSAKNNEDPFKPVSGEHAFTDPGRAMKTMTVGGPGERANLSGQEVAKQRQIFGVKEQNNNLNTFKQIVENNIPSHIIQIGEETITINKSIAKKIVKLHESLNRTNRNKLERMLNEDITSLTKVINFAIKQ